MDAQIANELEVLLPVLVMSAVREFIPAYPPVVDGRAAVLYPRCEKEWWSHGGYRPLMTGFPAANCMFKNAFRVLLNECVSDLYTC